MSRRIFSLRTLFWGPVILMSQTSCYTVKQGFEQARLILKRKPIVKVLEENKETPDRIEKMRLTSRVLEFAKEELGLTPGKSYQDYIALDGPSVTYVVQAASRRSLTFKTWWFPLVGSQPYLGFFSRPDAVEFQKKMKEEGYDTKLGGVQAFSLLGYFPDPLYSSMLDGNTLPELIEVIIHECVHRTLYIPNFSSFNENLADFIAKRATERFLELNQEIGSSRESYHEKFKKNMIAQGLFKEFLIRTKKELEEFYKVTEGSEQLKDEKHFLEVRELEFEKIAKSYKLHMKGAEIGTDYEYAFQSGRMNNAVILGYSLYEAKQEPFEVALKNAGGSLKTLLTHFARCFEGKIKDEDELWRRTRECK